MIIGISGLALAVAAIVIQVVLWAISARGKRLSVEVFAYQRATDSQYVESLLAASESKTPDLLGNDWSTKYVLNSTGEGLLARLKGRYGLRETDVTEPTLLKIIVANRGNQPIIATDFLQPLRIRLLEGSVERVKILASRDNQLRPKVRMRQKSVEIRPLLLNPGDWFVVSLRAAGIERWTVFDKVVKAESRIVGVARIVTSRALRVRYVIAIVSLLAVVYSGIAVYLWLVDLKSAPSWWELISISIAWPLWILIVMGGGMSWVKSRSRIADFTAPGDLYPTHYPAGTALMLNLSQEKRVVELPVENVPSSDSTA
jgi:hypothetical protein